MRRLRPITSGVIANAALHCPHETYVSGISIAVPKSACDTTTDDAAAEAPGVVSGAFTEGTGGSVTASFACVTVPPIVLGRCAWNAVVLPPAAIISSAAAAARVVLNALLLVVVFIVLYCIVLYGSYTQLYSTSIRIKYVYSFASFISPKR